MYQYKVYSTLESFTLHILFCNRINGLTTISIDVKEKYRKQSILNKAEKSYGHDTCYLLCRASSVVACCFGVV